LKFAPFNRDIIGSCSYDGTIRVWNANQMKLLSINDTLKNSPLKSVDKHIIYSLSWHPFESKLALVGSLGYLMIYDAFKSKLISY
jgi:WD40 repeat protein